jgi:DNA (cytosine-5)-methyltransferase 1
MFTGVGGFELGIERATNLRPVQQDDSQGPRKCDNPANEPSGWECVGYSEIDKFCNQVMRYRFQKIKNYGDAKTIVPDELPDFDLLCGGFPCQAFSIAGNRKGFSDTRGTLFSDIVRILRVKRPRFVLLENVKGLLNHDEGNTFGTIILSFWELGYDIQWMVLNSKFFGVPQNRERVFIIGSLRGQSRPEILPFRTPSEDISGTPEEAQGTGERVYDYIANTLAQRDYRGGNQVVQVNEPSHSSCRVYDDSGISPTIRARAREDVYASPKILTYDTEDSRPEIGQAIRRYGEDGVGPPLNNWSPIVAVKDKFQKTVYDTEGISPTVREGHGDVVRIMDLYNNKEHEDRCPALTDPKHNILRVKKGVNIRRLTPIECERLQSFPDNWTKFGIDDKNMIITISDSQRYKMLGNAVTVNVVEAIIKSWFGDKNG